jgi:RNA polymerase sigma factor (TIGR02999 family)
MQTAPDLVSSLMARLRKGDKEAAGQLVTLFYPELRRLARAKMQRERPGHSWQPTLLVNQLYLELVRIRALREDGQPGQDDEKQAFFGLAAHVMRRLLISHSRPLRQKAELIEFDDDIPSGQGASDELAVVESLLTGLERLHPEFRSVTELKVFEGLSMEQIADQLEIPLRTAYRRWTLARNWLASHV